MPRWYSLSPGELSAERRGEDERHDRGGEREHPHDPTGYARLVSGQPVASSRCLPRPSCSRRPHSSRGRVVDLPAGRRVRLPRGVEVMVTKDPEGQDRRSERWPTSSDSPSARCTPPACSSRGRSAAPTRSEDRPLVEAAADAGTRPWWCVRLSVRRPRSAAGWSTVPSIEERTGVAVAVEIKVLRPRRRQGRRRSTRTRIWKRSKGSTISCSTPLMPRWRGTTPSRSATLSARVCGTCTCPTTPGRVGFAPSPGDGVLDLDAFLKYCRRRLRRRHVLEVDLRPSLGHSEKSRP